MTAMPNQQTPIPEELNLNKIGELDTLSVYGDGFRAVVLLQGAQLVHFYTFDSLDNWLWVSENANHQRGVSVRGGVPICWPVFGVYEVNPLQVQQSFADCPFNVSKHGYARGQDFEFESYESSYMDAALGDATKLVLRLPNSVDSQTLDLQVAFIFSEMGFCIELITQNNTPDTIHYTQALHTYLPTADISKTTITGFDNVTYTDTLKDWQRVTQHDDILFNGEVDRIYHDAPLVELNTPTYRYNLTSTGSKSTVVWNPWSDKAKTLSQFIDTDYQRMLCIETANAHLDAVSLGAGDAHRLSMTIKRQKIND